MVPIQHNRLATNRRLGEITCKYPFLENIIFSNDVVASRLYIVEGTMGMAKGATGKVNIYLFLRR